MGIIDHIMLLESIHTQILHSRTGPPKEFAQRLDISERTLYRILDELRDRGAEIIYNHKRLSYCYQNHVEMSMSLRIVASDSVKIKGGMKVDLFSELPFLTVSTHNITLDIHWNQGKS